MIKYYIVYYYVFVLYNTYIMFSQSQRLFNEN